MEILVALLLATLYRRRRLRKRRQIAEKHRRRYWICPINRRRQAQGAWENLVQELLSDEPEKFKNYHRVDQHQFFELLRLVQPIIQRTTHIRAPIPAGLKLSLTLRYLATGDSMTSLAYAYRVGKSSTSVIIRETTAAIFTVLQPKYLKTPAERDWAQTASEFDEMWQFPNCVGAIDGKHIVVQCFNGTGSSYYNYKGSFSTSMLAVADAIYRFLYVSIGSKGRESDGGIFKNSAFGDAVVRERLPLPRPLQQEGFAHPLPAVFVGDQAFPLLPHMMRPYPASNLQPAQRIFNYRLSRARRVVENAFGILANRFRIFRKPIIACIETVDAIAQAAVVLHNWLITDDLANSSSRYITANLVDAENSDGSVTEGLWRLEAPSSGLVSSERLTAHRNPTVRAKATRDVFANYFMTTGQVPWQWRHLPN